LNSAIEVLVVECILVVPDSFARVSHVVTHYPNTIFTRVGLDLVHSGTCHSPCRNGSFHPHRVTDSRKCVIGWAAANRELAIRSVVIHVAFPRVRLAPGVFVWGDVLRFSEIGCAII